VKFVSFETLHSVYLKHLHYMLDSVIKMSEASAETLESAHYCKFFSL